MSVQKCILICSVCPVIVTALCRKHKSTLSAQVPNEKPSGVSVERNSSFQNSETFAGICRGKLTELRGSDVHLNCSDCHLFWTCTSLILCEVLMWDFKRKKKWHSSDGLWWSYFFHLWATFVASRGQSHLPKKVSPVYGSISNQFYSFYTGITQMNTQVVIESICLVHTNSLLDEYCHKMKLCGISLNLLKKCFFVAKSDAFSVLLKMINRLMDSFTYLLTNWKK